MLTPRPHRVAAALAGAVAALALAACGSTDTPAKSSSASQPTLINPVLPTGASPDDLKNCRGATTTKKSTDSPKIDCVAWREPNPATLPWPRLVELRKQIQGPEGRQRTVGATYLCGLLTPDNLKDFGATPLRSTYGDDCQVFSASTDQVPKGTNGEISTLRVSFKDETVGAPDGKDIRVLDGRTIAVDSFTPGMTHPIWTVKMETPTDGVLLSFTFSGQPFVKGLADPAERPPAGQPSPPLSDSVERLLKVFINASQQK